MCKGFKGKASHDSAQTTVDLGPKVNCNVQSDYGSQVFNVKLCKGLLPAFSTGLGPVLPFAPKSTVV